MNHEDWTIKTFQNKQKGCKNFVRNKALGSKKAALKKTGIAKKLS